MTVTLGFGKRILKTVTVYEFRSLPLLDEILEFFATLGVETNVKESFGFDIKADACVYVSSPGIASRALSLREKGKDPIVACVTPVREVICLSGNHWGGDELCTALAGWIGGEYVGRTAAEAERRPSVEDVLDALGLDPSLFKDEIVVLSRVLKEGITVRGAPSGVIRYLRDLGVKVVPEDEASAVIDVERGEVIVGKALRGGNGPGETRYDD